MDRGGEWTEVASGQRCQVDTRSRPRGTTANFLPFLVYTENRELGLS